MVAILVRLFVPANFLDLFYSYDLSGGGVLIKIHPGTYLLGCAALFATPLPHALGQKPLVASATILFGTSAICGLWALAGGKTLAVGFLLDAEIAAALGLFALSRLTARQRKRLFSVLLLSMMINAGILLIEFVTHTPFVARRNLLRDPRPFGILNHPLVNGLYYASLVPLVFLLNRPLLERMAIAGIFAAATFVSGARFASLFVLAGLAAAYIAAAQREQIRQARAGEAVNFQIILGLIVLPIFLIIGASSGLAYRFSSSIYDVSAKTRVDNFVILKYIDTKSFLIGAGNELLTSYANSVLNQLVENPFVFLIFMFGAIIGGIFLAGVLWSMYVILRTRPPLAWISATVFVLVGLSNNALVSKTPVLLYFMTILVTAPGASSSLEAPPASRSVRSRSGAFRSAGFAQRLNSGSSPRAR
ncbi:VpsF family polysaccharide biosynthesis protein [Phenylobacterium conjunctum]|uniref:VpsF family polysaccharide biosynthesis protein n=1 Tax=Phenylobacterium conjunctum TaxID=1298959 RepID=A0ABW3T5D8_9CAUL